MRSLLFTSPHLVTPAISERRSFRNRSLHWPAMYKCIIHSISIKKIHNKVYIICIVYWILSKFISDVNECEIEGSCSQICINEKGTYKCECEAGYLRDPQDHTRCKAMEGHASLLFSMQHNIRKISLDHHEMSAIINSTKSVAAIDFVFRTGMIFWGDVSEKKIYK